MKRFLFINLEIARNQAKFEGLKEDIVISV
jgi:hypothetical protein